MCDTLDTLEPTTVFFFYQIFKLKLFFDILLWPMLFIYIIYFHIL